MTDNGKCVVWPYNLQPFVVNFNVTEKKVSIHEKAHLNAQFFFFCIAVNQISFAMKMLQSEVANELLQNTFIFPLHSQKEWIQRILLYTKNYVKRTEETFIGIYFELFWHFPSSKNAYDQFPFGMFIVPFYLKWEKQMSWLPCINCNDSLFFV